MKYSFINGVFNLNRFEQDYKPEKILFLLNPLK